MEILTLLFFVCIAVAHTGFLFFQALQIKKLGTPSTSVNTTISIVICAHNEFDNLSDLIPLLLSQTKPPQEIIIILDRCNDDSEQLIKKFPKMTFLEVSETPPEIHPKKYGITLGIDNAASDWILLTDADCRPKENWLQEMSHGMSEGKDVAIGLSPYVKRSSFLNQLIQYETFQTAFQMVGLAAMGKPYMALGRNMAYRKSAFIEQNGFGQFRDVIGGDDDLLSQSIFEENNYSLILSPESHVDSIPKKNWRSYFRQKVRLLSVGTYYPTWVKISESLRFTIHVLFWLSFFLSMAYNPWVSLPILALALLIKGISINIVSDRLGKRFNHLGLPFVDLVYAVLIPLLSLRSLLVKNITWK